ncbi:nuclear distribution protein NUDC [Schizosaccharomyces japonicus yFS275]|uniref:Nuclear movement protein nudC n=1 Tax=Schizosaccharomyces japonicus (strain yFS275 / FY16936) TaxID=402676 RepID=B6JYS9_SCHJY|nr:nuclear distribution protein NUDC [Schizosaccharomyces japonicus yFS275]EEB06697.1 nuclear distribution protein NUDC [Schizosaccharomyces japonicus yFS275]
MASSKVESVNFNGVQYQWTQTLREVDITIDVPNNTRGKWLKVCIKPNYIEAVLQHPEPKTLLSGSLYKNIIVDESTWTVEEQCKLVIHLEKSNKMEWWSSVIKGHPEIDISTIEPDNSNLTDLDPDMRATVEKLMTEQRQKQQREHSANQQKKKVLQDFIEQHPELDFSKVKNL